MSPSSSTRTTAVASPRISPSPTGSKLTVLYQPILSANSGFGAIHEATVENGVVTDRTVVQSTSGELAESTAGYAVLSVPRPGIGSVWNGPHPATLDLNTGAVKVYDVGSGTTTCLLRSPDPTKLLVCQWSPPNQTFVVLDLPSRVGTGLGAMSALTWKPIGWSEEGIFFASCGAASCSNGASVLDPQTLAVMQISADGYVSSVSPSGIYLGGTKNLYAGDPSYCSDSIFVIRNDWGTVVSGARLGSESPLVSQAKKDFRIVAIEDDGSVLYTESDCPPGYEMPWGPTNLYYHSGGRPTLQSGLGEIADVYSMAAPQSPGLLLGGVVAIVSRHPNGFSEVDLVQLCTYDGCQPTVTMIARGDASVEAYAFSVLP